MSLDSIHQFEVDRIDGGKIRFSDFKGRKIMVVNVASECGYTPQYQQLEELHRTFEDRLAIVGFPSNDFGGQEPGSDSEILDFCTTRYGVQFPMAAKIRVKGDRRHPVYAWLCQKDLNGVMDKEVQWNFNKFLLDERGHLQSWHPASVSPIDPPILDWIAG